MHDISWPFLNSWITVELYNLNKNIWKSSEISSYLVQVKIEFLVFSNVITNAWQHKEIKKPTDKQQISNNIEQCHLQLLCVAINWGICSPFDTWFYGPTWLSPKWHLDRFSRCLQGSQTLSTDRLTTLLHV